MKFLNDFSSGEEREARAVFSREISNLESAALFAFSSSAALQVRQRKAERKNYAPISRWGAQIFTGWGAQNLTVNPNK